MARAKKNASKHKKGYTAKGLKAKATRAGKKTKKAAKKAKNDFIAWFIEE